ncbi:hypothetical protein DCC39_12605 [Pueribacillus theae]|uniref:Uncharacterized protein n=1 Tax=Pueribacillus theae TaxID=2171751 RepID=A0A2U1JWT8_9BACI|nr:hypothetical protein [Pueribacillus theae]PWA09680.1 hypothetical protein DCC39_12605 [Pueribacillus theae]
MEERVKVIPLFLEGDTYKVNIVVSNITENVMINGTCRNSYVVSIPEWRWSVETGASLCHESYWQDNLRDNIDYALEKYIPEISKKLSNINMKKIF